MKISNVSQSMYIEQWWKLLTKILLVLKLNLDEDTRDNNLFYKVKAEIWKDVKQMLFENPYLIIERILWLRYNNSVCFNYYPTIKNNDMQTKIKM